MLTLYLSCLVVGGVFVGLSAAGAVGKDLDTDADADADVDADLDADVDADVGVGHEGPEHAIAISDASQALTPHESRSRKLWLPVFSLRFWTYGAAFFGLTGTLLSTLTPAGPVFVALASAATGVGSGTASAWLVRWLRRPVGASIRTSDYAGSSGELVAPLRAGGVTRIRLRVNERERTMLAVSPEPQALDTGTRVLVLGVDPQGRALIEPERTIYDEET
jgi:hypothetical protein